MQIFGEYKGQGVLAENEPLTSFEVKSTEELGKFDYQALVNIGRGLRPTYQIDPLLAFCQGVDYVNWSVHYTFPNEDSSEYSSARIYGHFSGSAYLMHDGNISSDLTKFSVDILTKNSNPILQYPVRVIIEGVFDEIFYGINPMKIFALGCNIVCSKLAYFDKY